MDKTTVDNNELFDRLPASDRRVTIARDVIAQLDAQKFSADSNVWCNEGYDSKCDVCAVGAIFASACELTNRDKDSVGRYCFSDLNAVLKNYFDEKQLILVEFAYERGAGNFTFQIQPGDFDEDDCEYFYPDTDISCDSFDYRKEVAALNFCKDLPLEDRMRKIMWNIIQNKGEFDPTVETVVPSCSSQLESGAR